MQYVHVRNIEAYHPGYKDRMLHWAKIHCSMVQGDPDCELITEEIDWGRLIKFILLELAAQKPIPLDMNYLTKKGFNLKKRPITLTLQMLHNFIDIVTEDSKVCIPEESRVEKNRVEESSLRSNKITHLEFVFLKAEEFESLKNEYGVANADAYIARLNAYVGSSGKKYKSHYHTILNWMVKDNLQKMVKRHPPDPTCLNCRGEGYVYAPGSGKNVPCKCTKG